MPTASFTRPSLRAVALATLVGFCVPLAAQDAPPGYEWRAFASESASPSPYPANATGLRTEIVIDGAVLLRLHFAWIDTEQGFDLIRIRDGREELVTTLSGSLQDQTSPVIKGDRAYLDLYSDYSTNGRGFLVDRVDACVPRAAPAPTEAGPRWIEMPYDLATPSPYPDNLYKAPFTVTCQGAKSIRLYFEYVDVERFFDSLDIVSPAGQLVSRLSGTYGAFWTDPIEGDHVDLFLTSDFSTAGRGFRISRIAAWMPGGGVTPAPGPAPATGPLARLEVFVLDEGEADPLPIGDDVFYVAPRGRPGDTLDVLVAGFDASGRQIAPDQVRFEIDVHGDIGTAVLVAPGEILFTAGRVPGATGELHVRTRGVPEPSPVQIVVGRGDGRDGRPGRGGRGIASLLATLETASGVVDVAQDGLLLYFDSAEGRTARVRVAPTARGGRPVVSQRPIGYRVRAPAGMLSVLQRPDGIFEIQAGRGRLDDGLVEFFVPNERGEEVRTQVRVRVTEMPPTLTALRVEVLRGELSDDHLYLGLGAQPAELRITALDQRGRAMTIEGLGLVVDMTGERVVDVRDAGGGRFIVTPVRAGRAQLAFRDAARTVSSQTIDVVVRRPRFQRASFVFESGGQWLELPAEGVLLNPLGQGLDNYTLELRAYDEFGNIMPPELAPALVLEDPRRAATLESLGANRYRVRATGDRTLEGGRLILRGAEGGQPLATLPLRIAAPAPRLTSLAVRELAAQGRRPLSATDVVDVPLGSQDNVRPVEIELVALDQRGQEMAGQVLEPSFAIGGDQLLQVRRISSTPSVWRLQPMGRETPPVRMDVSIAGTALKASFNVRIFDPNYATLGTQVAAEWVKWGHDRDYDFPVPSPLAGSRNVRIETTGRLNIQRVYLQLAKGQWVEVPASEISLAAGASGLVALPDALTQGQSIVVVRLHGYSDPGCRISVALRQPTR